MAAQGDFSHLDELSFYQDKFRIMVDIFNQAIANKTKKSKVQADISTLVANKFGEPPASAIKDLVNNY